MMSSKEEETLRFFQYVEENGLRAYNGLVAQNLDHARNERNRTFLQEKNDKKRKQEEAIRRTGEDIATEGKHLRMGSITMLDPQERMPMPHPHALACGQGFSVRSQSLHSVGGGNSGGGGEEEVGSPTSRKQPPPKPRRDPATKLSMSSEAVDHSPTSTCHGERCDAAQGCSEDCRRVPPPKPKRNPNTQLSVSFDESYIKSHGGSGVCPSRPLHYVTSPCERNPSPAQSDESPTDDCEDEPVYIEMGGIDVGAREPLKSEDEEPGESVYEEMKYPALDDMEYRTDPVGCRSACPTPAPYDPEPLSRCSTPRNIPLCDIPAPFPNLLTHRPPLLVFPPAPAQCSPNSDESPLTPLDVTKLPMLENQSYSKSPTSSTEPPSSAHIRRELTATPTLTVSGRSSAPPLPCTLYKSSSSSYQRSHSACPSPVSMGRCLTPLSLMRTPPFEAPMPFPGGLPRSASATPHGKGSPPQDGVGRLHGSMQNVSTGRSRTPTSPLDELTNLFTTGRNMLKKNASGRKSKEPGETESKSKSHSESKREGKERHSHSKESKRDSKDRHSKESSHRRDRDKDRDKNRDRRNSKDRTYSGADAPAVRRDSRDQGCSSVEPIPLIRRDSKDRGLSNGDLMLRRDSKDRGGGHGMEPLLRQDSKDRLLDQPPELLPRQDGKERARNGVDSRHESRERLLDQPPELLPRQDSKERARNGADSKHESRDRPPELLPRQEFKDKARTGAEYRHDSKDHRPEVLPPQDFKERARNDMEHRHEGRIDQPPEILPRQETSRRSNSKDTVGYSSESKHEGRDRSCHNGGDLPPPPLPRQDSKDLSRTGLEVRRDSKDRSLNGSEQHHYAVKSTKSPSAMEYRCDSKERGYRSDGTPRRDKRENYTTDQSKAQERNGSTVSGQHSSTTTPTHHARSSGSPPMTIGTGNDLKAAPKYGRSHSIPANPSPMGTPQRKAAETHQSQMPQMPWICGDTTMLEQIERKRTLCMEIRSRQHPHLQRFLERPPPPPDRNEDRHQERSQCKQESASVLPGWGKSSGAKKIRPPPYPTQKTVFWDTAI
ncbi:serine/arginine repetitive matrix protein 2 [Perca flavescens]|uniref:serine/arginine repetitive matrix protein 2 n=1 Tax=Perca flavescens TaxID=8167 RepID=UPI00106E5ECB|nr:serine/arginine repetitive matrix protein 2-like [Perca flavescens]